MIWTQCDGYEEAEGKDFTVTLYPRPGYCDRGNFLAQLFQKPGTGHALLDFQDAWPRYYFDKERAKLEIEAWFKKRGQLLPPAH